MIASVKEIDALDITLFSCINSTTVYTSVIIALDPRSLKGRSGRGVPPFHYTVSDKRPNFMTLIHFVSTHRIK